MYEEGEGSSEPAARRFLLIVLSTIQRARLCGLLAAGKGKVLELDPEVLSLSLSISTPTPQAQASPKDQWSQTWGIN